MANKNVHVWNKTITLPTYKVSSPEKAPLFIENRAYQGSTGKVYPLPVTEKIADEKEDVDYNAIYLENDYLKVMILPELGGRIQRAYDKTNGYDFVYYNHVIKPALVGLTGPWVSGGIEFNWPQHHRPSTYSPVDYSYRENEDGSASVYVSEIDKMYGTKGMGIFTLYPDKAYIEIKGQLYNNTDLPQTFLWWANPAVPVNDNTYSVFPPDVHAVMDHGKRAVSTFPIATGEYYKYDYSEGIDISMYKNVKVPTSYMAAHSDYDFIGNYDKALRSGLLHVADHHISPGKKQWTWGNADFGKAWDRNLTDEDGPYIELMTGVYTDNQPDFTWLKPQEEKTFTQYFMPYKGVGRIKNATKDAMINLEIKNGKGYVYVYTSGVYENLKFTVENNFNNCVYEKVFSTDPVTYFEDSFDTLLSEETGCTITLFTEDNKELTSYTFTEDKPEPTPDPAKPLPVPVDVKTVEELYLAGLHLEQYRHATTEPADYYEEGLRRDPGDIRINNSYGVLLLKRGYFDKAKVCFEKAIERQTWKNPNPYTGECYLNLGLVNFYLENYEEAYDAFYKSTWSQESQSIGYYWLGVLSARDKKFEEALRFINDSLIRNWHNIKARTLKLAIMRILNLDTEAFINESKKIDPLYMGVLYEEGLKDKKLDDWCHSMRNFAHNFLELSLLYMDAGFYEDAIIILNHSPEESPMIFYYKSYVYSLMEDSKKAIGELEDAEKSNFEYCCPNRICEITILNKAIEINPEGSYAYYYLGNLLYDKKQYDEAIRNWETSAALNPDFAMAHRNLSIAYYNKRKDSSLAFESIANAFKLDSSYPRFLLEYDQMAANNLVSPKERLALLNDYLPVVKERDALYVEYIKLLNLTGDYDTALDCINTHLFHPWEGGEGKVSSQYRYALTEKAIILMNEKEYKKAIDLLKISFIYPDNLGEGKLPNVQDTIAQYYIGKCYEALGEKENADTFYTMATNGLDEPSLVLYYNDQPSDTILYQGFAHLALGNEKAAKKCFHQLKAFGEKHLFDNVHYDFFAVSLPELNVYQEDIKDNNVVYCNYLIALSNIGLGNYETAKEELGHILKAHPDHQGAIQHMNYINRLS